MIEETADAIILRWPGTPQRPVAPKAKAAWRQRLEWLALPIWIVRLAVECIGWLAVLGLLTTWS